jgi:F-type H+-transporting ATPase subunit alpha
METNILFTKIKSIEDNLQKELNNLLKAKTTTTLRSGMVGYVSDFADGVGHISGLDIARIGQKLQFPESTERARRLAGEEELEIFGLAVDVDEDSIGCIVFGEERFIKQGDKITVADELLTIPVTEKMLGRVIDPFCRPLDGVEVPPEHQWLNEEDNTVKDGILELPIERKAPSVIDRSKIKEPLQTGIKAVDSMLPIGRGQRMLVIGDRATGKTSVGIDTIVNQNRINRSINKNRSGFEIHNIDTHDPDTVYCIYVAVGRKASEVRQIAKQLEEKGALEYTTIIAAMANDPAPLLFIAPFAGCTLGEYFRDRGRHALIMYDDLSKHASAYRQISLLLRRPPGREAYPGDIFYLHSRLLERGSKIAGKQSKYLDLSQISDDYKAILQPFLEKGLEIYGGGSLTALPYVETKQNDYASYIPTNIISITDGQIYLSDKLFNEGFRPAINIGISVSRVGSKAQTAAIKEVSDGLKGYLANYREKEKYTKFGLNPSESDIAVLDRGRRLIHILKQPQYSPVEVEREVISLFTIRKGFFDILPDNQKLIQDFENCIWEHLQKDNELQQKVIELQKPRIELSSLITSSGVLFIEKFSEKLDSWQIDFMKDEKVVRHQLLSIILPSLNTTLKGFYDKYNIEIDRHLTKPQALSGTIIANFLSVADSIPVNYRLGDFSRVDQAPAPLRVNDYKDDITCKFMFAYFIEEKQRLKREFCLKCEKEYPEIVSEEIDENTKKKISKLAKEFLIEDKDHPEAMKRMEKIKDKAKDFIRGFVDKQVAEVQKLKALVQRQKKHIVEHKSDPTIRIDDFNRNSDTFIQNLNKFFDNFKEVSRNLDKIENFMQ